jgi:competence protein ComEC
MTPGGSRIEALRHAMTARIRADLPGPEGGLAAALITGATGAFRDAGLAHILVIAGLHMGRDVDCPRKVVQVQC